MYVFIYHIPCASLAATVRTACINCPGNRDAVHEVEGVKRLLYYIGEEMADVISEALDAGALCASVCLCVCVSVCLCVCVSFIYVNI